jgi:hypothetical protein
MLECKNQDLLEIPFAINNGRLPGLHFLEKEGSNLGEITNS